MRAFLIVSVMLSAAPALADETSGTILAFDRVANIMVLDDKTVWSLGEKTEVTPDLMAGDTVKIIYLGCLIRRRCRSGQTPLGGAGLPPGSKFRGPRRFSSGSGLFCRAEPGIPTPKGMKPIRNPPLL
jgi:hypothetical protein